MNIRFDMLWGHFDKSPENTGEIHDLANMNPQMAMHLMGITYKKASPQSICDQWWFYDCDNLPEPLPSFLTEL